MFTILPQELLSFSAKYKPAGSNHFKNEISQTSRFGCVLLRSVLVAVVLFLFCPVSDAAAMFSGVEMYGTGTTFNVSGNIENNKTKSDLTKNSLFDRLSVRGMDIELLGAGSDFSSPFQPASLRMEFFPQSEIFYNPTNYRYENCDSNQTPYSETQKAVIHDKFARRRCNVRDYFRRKFPLVSSDFRNFNSCDSLGNLFVAFGGAAILANTSLDVDFRNWFYRNVSRPNINNNTMNDFNAFTKEFGEMPVILIFALSTAGYKLFPYIFPKYEKKQSILGEYATMVSRGYLVGTPANLLGQLFVGAGRPSRGTSFWFKGKFNGVSGHAFVGAVPFITAAQMTDNFWLKFILYTCSTFTATSRIYEDSHYLSQALLGWYIAYLSVRAISKTEGRKYTRGLTIFPIVEKENAGVGIIIKF
ncbi:MAG: phosphatase PAP2 family protein [Planctomycetaceae bacterium]|jgi:hypothetical protein|nr:phosphatase PAP2 family protein [Planctomycetaceae bacterium]